MLAIGRPYGVEVVLRRQVDQIHSIGVPQPQAPFVGRPTPGEGQPDSVRRPVSYAVIGFLGGDTNCPAAVGSHQIDLGIAVLIGDECQVLTVRGPKGSPVVTGDVGQSPGEFALVVDDIDLQIARLIGYVSHILAVRRPDWVCVTTVVVGQRYGFT